MPANFAADGGRGRATTFAANPVQKPFVHPPLPAVTREKINPRIRVQSQTQNVSRHQGANRAVTMAVVPRGDPNPLPPSDPILREMQRGILFDIGSILDQFTDYDREVRAFCDSCADHYAGIAQLPRMTRSSNTLSPGNFVFKSASDFPSVEDYVFFSLLSIINTHVYNDIFRPFHPAGSKEDNLRNETEYERQVETVLQVTSADWRSRRFRAMEATVSSDLRRAVLRRIIDSISVAFKLALSEIRQDQLPDGFELRIRSILESAYKWNSTVKRDIIKYDFEPFIVEPGSAWDAEQMEPFERVRDSVKMPVVSTVALGLIGSIALGGRRVSHVQLKAKVLVDEWFRKTGSRPRTISNMPRPPLPIAPPLRGGPSVSIALTPPPNLITKQPTSTRPMDRSGNNDPMRQMSEGEEKGGCC